MAGYSLSSRKVLLSGFLAIATLLATATAHSQQSGSSLEEVGYTVQPGDTLIRITSAT